MRAGKPAVFGSPEHSDIIREHALRIGADLRVAGQDFRIQEDDSAASWSWHGREYELAGLRRPALVGDVQVRNASAVLAVIEAMGFGRLLSTNDVNVAFARLKLAGRFQARTAMSIDTNSRKAAKPSRRLRSGT